MAALTELALILVVVIDFLLLASGRLRASVRVVAVQGALLSVLPLALSSPGAHHPLHVAALAIGALLVKAFAIPALLFWAMREVEVERESSPSKGSVPALALGALGVALAFALSRGLPMPFPTPHRDLVPAALSTVWVGLMLIVSRRKAASQVLGFLVLENGVFLFGLLLSDFMPVMVEAGVLLDLFAAVFVMGLVMFHINREFSSLDTGRMDALKDE